MAISMQVRESYVRLLTGVRAQAAENREDQIVDFGYRDDRGKLHVVEITAAPDGVITMTDNGVVITEPALQATVIERMAARLQAVEDAHLNLFNARENYGNLRDAEGNYYSGTAA
jgi:hypothetical protein